MPRFTAAHGQVECEDCCLRPLAVTKCTEWLRSHEKFCPTAATWPQAQEFFELHRHTIVAIGGAHG